jgi:ABC-2 type transport system ATP-binding protein
MDPKGRQEMLDLIKDISYNKGINIILSSHLLPDVEYTCKDVAIIHKGRLVIQGDIEQLKGTNQSLFEVKFKGERQVFLTALQKAGCQFWEPENDASETLRVSIPAPMTSQMLFKIAAENSTQIRHLVAIRHSLEDIFAQALGEV